MINRVRNNERLFKAFADAPPDRTGIILSKIGRICFTSSFVASVLLPEFGAKYTTVRPLLVLVGGVGFIGGVLMFIATGTHYLGKENNEPNFLRSSVYVVKQTFKYILFPALIVTVLAIMLAIATNNFPYW